MKKQKILAISVGRSDYDRFFPILSGLNKFKQVDLYIFVSKSHQDKIFGKTINFIDKKFKILKTNFKNLRQYDLPSSFASDLITLNKKIKNIKPDKIIVLGDRFEMLLGPIAAITHNLPVIHFYGGSITQGATDELVRHAITKMSHLHFALLPEYKKRIIQLGEEKWRVKNVGMHELSLLKKNKKFSKNYLNEKFNFNFKIPYMLVTFHPVTLELHNTLNHLNSLFSAIQKTKYNAIITYPNADPNHNKIIKFINEKFKNKKRYLIIKNCGKDIYASLLKNSTLLVGNSSSGIVESATFKIPSINIGTRQEGKVKPQNVIDTGYSKTEILKGIKRAESKNFLKKIKKLKNPYENILDLRKILRIIINLKRDDRVLRKKFVNLRN